MAIAGLSVRDVGRMYRVACVRKMCASNYVNERRFVVVDETWHGVRDVSVNVRDSLRCAYRANNLRTQNSCLNTSRRLRTGIRTQHACARIALANFAARNL